MTKAEKTIDWLISKGYKEIQSNSKKYRKFTHTKPDRFFFVGKHGALRVGRNISESISITDRIQALNDIIFKN